MTDLEVIAAWVASGVGIITGATTVYNMWGKPIVNGMIAFIKRAIKTINDASQIHEIIKTELTVGDGSLKDSLLRIEQKMFIQDNKHRAMLSLLDRPVWEADDKGMFVWVNRAFIKIIGRDIEDLKNSGWISMVHADDRERVSKEWNHSVSQNRTFSSKYRIIQHDGKVIDCLGEAFPVESVDHNGTQVSKTGFVGVLSIKNLQKIAQI